MGSYYKVKTQCLHYEAELIGPQRQDITGDWRKLQDEELHDLFSLPYIIWMIVG
jgi:hypothetical protein